MLTNAAKERTPSSDTVQRLIAIWEEVLQVKVGPADPFFDLGGDSLTAMSCIFLIRSAFGVDFTVEDFLIDDASINTFAAAIDKKS